VEKLSELLSVDLETVFKLINMDGNTTVELDLKLIINLEESTKKHPFPCPCTYRTAVRKKRNV
jgi:NADPH-ferrihemoprotein reductase